MENSERARTLTTDAQERQERYEAQREADRSARDWGDSRIHELVREMHSNVGDHAAEFDTDPERFMTEALKAMKHTLAKY